jgi:hypothetical protein
METEHFAGIGGLVLFVLYGAGIDDLADTAPTAADKVPLRSPSGGMFAKPATDAAAASAVCR